MKVEKNKIELFSKCFFSPYDDGYIEYGNWGLVNTKHLVEEAEIVKVIVRLKDGKEVDVPLSLSPIFFDRADAVDNFLTRIEVKSENFKKAIKKYKPKLTK